MPPSPAVHRAGLDARPPASVLVVLAASAGGISALETVLGALPASLAAAVAVVQHRPPVRPSALVEILERATRLRVTGARAGEALLASTVYVAPADKHLTVMADGKVRLVDGHRIHGVCSSADPLLETAPLAFGANVVAVVLTGYGSDGSDGVRRVAAAGGAVIAQAPWSAFAPGMPEAAIATGNVGSVLPLAEIAPEIERLVRARRVR